MYVCVCIYIYIYIYYLLMCVYVRSWVYKRGYIFWKKNRTYFGRQCQLLPVFVHD
jgi:hypothetical protein